MKGKFLSGWSSGRRVVCFLLVAFLALGSIALSDTKPTRSKSPAFYGLHGDTSNTLDPASPRYGVVAPFAPTPKDGFIPETLDEMDNHFVYLFDTKKPKSEPIAADLIYCYYPSQVHFDEKKSVVLVRGVEYVEPKSGDPYIGDVLVHVGLNLESDRKPYFEDTSIAPIRIENPNYGFDRELSADFFLGYDKNIILLTNGEAIIAINRSEGYQYPVYFTGSRITYLDYNDASRLVTVGLSRMVESADGSCSYKSELRFYEMESSGVINLKTRITETGFPEGVGLLPESKVVVSRSQVVNDKVQSFQAYLPTSDGALWVVDFLSGADSGIEDVAKFSKLIIVPELSEDDCGRVPSPRTLTYDSTRRTLTVVRRGGARHISRPSLIRKAPRGISRPSLIERRGNDVVAMFQFDKKGNLVSHRVYGDEFAGKGGVSNLLLDKDASTSYIATYDGDVFSFTSAGEGELPVLSRIGKIGPRVSSIMKWGVDNTIIGVSSFEVDGDGRFLGLGSLVVARVSK